MIIKKDTTTKMQTKDWEHMSIRLPKEIKTSLYEDAKRHLRPVGMHLTWILGNHFNLRKWQPIEYFVKQENFWTDERVLEFAKTSTAGSYGKYKGCKTLKEKMERFKSLVT